MNCIKIPHNIWETTRHHLLDRPGEHFAFFVAEPVEHVNGGITLLVRNVNVIDDENLECEGFGARLKVPALLDVINAANGAKMALIEIHNHLGGWDAEFSKTDLAGFKEFVPYVLDSLPGRPYAALVMTPDDSIDGTLFHPDRSRGHSQSFRSEAITSVHIIGSQFRKIVTTSGRRTHKDSISDAKASISSIHARQVLAFGAEGQRMLASTKVAIVGLGGLGSHVAQQLAYLGVRDFTLVDPDIVEITNLNRLVGATIRDIGKYKVDIAERNISGISGRSATVTKIPMDLRTEDAFAALKQADVIFGCVDTSGARMILNEISMAYLIPYIDCATGIETDASGAVTNAGGHVMVVNPPDGACMLCGNLIDVQEAANDLASEVELEDKKKHGYISGVKLPDPSVVSLNGYIASLAVIEFQSLVTGLRPVRTCTVYDMLASRGSSTVEYVVTMHRDCIHQTYTAIGDKVGLERYLTRSGVPMATKTYGASDHDNAE